MTNYTAKYNLPYPKTTNSVEPATRDFRQLALAAEEIVNQVEHNSKPRYDQDSNIATFSGLVTVHGFFPSQVPDTFPITEQRDETVAVPGVGFEGTIVDEVIPENIPRVVGGKIPEHFLPDTASVTNPYAAMDATLPPPAILDPASLQGDAGAWMPIPTHDGSGQAVHPEAHHFPTGLWGYKWWMNVTGYANRGTRHEDPILLASHDGFQWEVPDGAPFPLDDAGEPGDPDYNSDPALLVDDGVMYAYWRRFKGPPDATTTIYVRTTTDGRNFTPATPVFHGPTDAPLSPSIVPAPGGEGFEMFSCRYSGGVGTVQRRTSETPVGPWSDPVNIDFTLPAGREVWHIEVRRVGDWYLALGQDRMTGANGGGELFIGTSTDGETWDVAPGPVAPHSSPQHSHMYQGTLVPYPYQGQWRYRLIYTGFNANPIQSWLYATDLYRR